MSVQSRPVTGILETLSRTPHYRHNDWTVANPRPPHYQADIEQTPITTDD
jgi:hypothetical protein